MSVDKQQAKSWLATYNTQYLIGHYFLQVSLENQNTVLFLARAHDAVVKREVFLGRGQDT
ncbi:hypothetical protein N7501_004279 [Penicillium viridicatum]|nr:hypothetical protein N7501_004279 [Penicillium viridicatum]